SSSARVTVLHGPHHGAQKSTTTGLGAPRTSCSKLESVTERNESQTRRQRRPVRARTRSCGTFQIASSTIARLIFEWPSSRSENEIGTSTTRKPALITREVVSILKEKPRALIASRSIVSSTFARKHLTPPVRSRSRLPSQT